MLNPEKLARKALSAHGKSWDPAGYAWLLEQVSLAIQRDLEEHDRPGGWTLECVADKLSEAAAHLRSLKPLS